MPTLDFKGKQFIYSHHHSVPFRELVVDNAKSLSQNPNLDDNLIINGDNLHALKALMPQYAGKIKCIYIDPPYNTGNEGWCYNDNVNSPLMKEWLQKNANPVDKEDMQRHDKWLCMMYPRLKLLHELLADDGAIVVHIDENENHSLRMILEEIFGVSNFLGEIVWDKRNPKGDSGSISYQHELILCFSKNIEIFKVHNDLLVPKRNAIKMIAKAEAIFKQVGKKCVPNSVKAALKILGIEEESSHAKQYTLNDANIDFQTWLSQQNGISGGEAMYKYIDEYGDIYRLVSMAWPNNKKAPDDYFIPLKHPVSGKACPVPSKGWRNPPKTMAELISKNLIVFGADESVQPQRKYFLKENMEENIPSLLYYGSSDDVLLTNLGISFDNSKPVDVLVRVLQAFAKPNDIILDSFAGSGTTAHAVLDLNKEDSGNRKFILVEMEDYADNITAERVRRVIKGVPTAKDEKLKQGLGGSFTFCTLGKEISIEKIITGESLPDYAALAKYVFYTATGKSLVGEVNEKPNYFVGETDLYEVYLIYKADMAFLRSNDSALNDAKLRSITEGGSKKEKLVFATAKYRGQDDLRKQNITFCQLPYTIHKVVGA